MQRYSQRLGTMGPEQIPDSEGLWVLFGDVGEISNEITRLQAIIDRIPTMADGEPTLIGETAFVRWNNGTIVECTILSVHQSSITTRIPSENLSYVSLSQVYKTRQAAEQAGITDQKAREELTAVIHDILSSYYEETREMDQARFIVDKYGSKQ